MTIMDIGWIICQLVCVYAVILAIHNCMDDGLFGEKAKTALSKIEPSDIITGLLGAALLYLLLFAAAL